MAAVATLAKPSGGLPAAPALTASDKKLLINAVGAQCFGLLPSQAISGGVMLLYLNALKLDAATILVVLALGPLFAALINVPLAYAADKVGIKKFGQIGNVLILLGMALIIAGPNAPGKPLAWIITGLLIHKLGETFFGTGWFALLSHVVPSHYTGRFFGILRFSWQLVGIVFFGVVSLFFTDSTPIVVYQILLTICGCGILIRGFFYRGIPEVTRSNVSSPFFPSVRSALSIPGYLSYLAYVFLLVFFTAEAPDMLRLMARQSLHFGDHTVLTMSVGGMVGALCGFFLGGKLADRWGTRPLFVACHFGFGFCLVVFPFRTILPVPAPVLACLVTFLLAMVQAIISIAFTSETFAVCSTRHRVLAMGLISSFQTLASALSGFFFSSILKIGALQHNWEFHGIPLTIYDTVLLLFSFMVILLVVTLGLIPSVIKQNNHFPASTE